jgi:hypothetical protein
VADLVDKVAPRMAVTKKVNAKNRIDAKKVVKASRKGNKTMKCLLFMSSFVLEKMCKLIKTGVRTDKWFKEVHLTAVAKSLFEYYGVYVSST